MTRFGQCWPTWGIGRLQEVDRGVAGKRAILQSEGRHGFHPVGAGREIVQPAPMFKRKPILKVPSRSVAPLAARKRTQTALFGTKLRTAFASDFGPPGGDPPIEPLENFPARGHATRALWGRFEVGFRSIWDRYMFAALAMRTTWGSGAKYGVMANGVLGRLTNTYNVICITHAPWSRAHVSSLSAASRAVASLDTRSMADKITVCLLHIIAVWTAWPHSSNRAFRADRMLKPNAPREHGARLAEEEEQKKEGEEPPRMSTGAASRQPAEARRGRRNARGRRRRDGDEMLMGNIGWDE